MVNKDKTLKLILITIISLLNSSFVISIGYNVTNN